MLVAYGISRKNTEMANPISQYVVSSFHGLGMIGVSNECSSM